MMRIPFRHASIGVHLSLLCFIALFLASLPVLAVYHRTLDAAHSHGKVCSGPCYHDQAVWAATKSHTHTMSNFNVGMSWRETQTSRDGWLGGPSAPRHHSTGSGLQCELLALASLQRRTPVAIPPEQVATPPSLWPPVSPADRRLASGDEPIRSVIAGPCALSP